MSPFLGAAFEIPQEPGDEDPDAWQAFSEEMAARLAGHTDYLDNDLGSLCLMVKSGARAMWRQLAGIVGPRGAVRDVEGNPFSIRHGWRDGLTPEEMFVSVVGARRGLARVLAEVLRLDETVIEERHSAGHDVIARARRSARPGVVFARAAASNASDRLEAAESRLFVGLPVAAQ